MKRLIALLLAAIMVCGLFTVSISAHVEVISPEHGESRPLDPDPEPEPPVDPPIDPVDPPVEPVDPPVDDDPTVDIGDDKDPTASIDPPTSPQTGYETGILWIVAAAFAFGAMAVVSTKKLFQR